MRVAFRLHDNRDLSCMEDLYIAQIAALKEEVKRLTAELAKAKGEE